MAYNQYSLPSGSYENDQLFKTDNIYLILRYIAAMYSGSEYELRYLAPFRSTDKFTIGQLSPSSSLSGSVEHNLSSSILFRLLGPSGSGVIHRQLTVGDYNLDPTASLRVDGLVRIMGGSPFSGAVLSSISSDGLAEWINPSILSTNSSGSSGTTSPAIPTNSVQYNNNNTFGGSAFFTYNSSSHHLNISGAISSSYGLNTIGFYGTASWAISSSKANSSSYAETSSYVTTLRASEPTRSIQFNSGGLLSGSSHLTYIDTLHQLILSGSQQVNISGSEAGLQIFGQLVSQSSLSGLPFLIDPTDREISPVFVPFGAYGQLWILVAPAHAVGGPAIIYDINSDGSLTFKGYIGNSDGQTGRIRGRGIYIPGISRLVTVGYDVDKAYLYVYDPNTIDIQSTGFSYDLNSSNEISLIEFSCSMKDNDGGVIPFSYGYNPVLSSYTGEEIILTGLASSSNGDASTPLRLGTPLSASIASLSSSNQNLSSSADLFPLGFFMTSADAQNPSSTSYVSLTESLLTDWLIPKHKIMSGSFNGSTLTFLPSYTSIIAYNTNYRRIYCLVELINNAYACIVELDNSVRPAVIVNIHTGSATFAPARATGLGSMCYNNNTDRLAVKMTNGNVNIYDGTTTIDWESPVHTVAVPLAYREIIAIDNDFFLAGQTIPTGQSSNGPIIEAKIIQLSSASGYNSVSGSIVSYYTESVLRYSGFSSLAYASAPISRIYTFDRSNIIPRDYTISVLPHAVFENAPINQASANKVYKIDTGSLDITLAFDLYNVSVSNGVNNLVEYRDHTSSLLSYVNPNGIFIGTSSLALTASYTPHALVSASLNATTLSLYLGNSSSFVFTLPTSSAGTGSSNNPGGNFRSIQFNSGSTFGGINSFTVGLNTSSIYFTGSLYVSGSINSENIFGTNASIYNIGATSIASVGFTGSLLGTASYATTAYSSAYAETASYFNDTSIVRRLSNGTIYQFATWGTSDKIQPLANMISDDSSLQINLLTGLYTPGTPTNILTIDAGNAGDMNYGLDITGSLYVSGSSQVTGSVKITGSVILSGTFSHEINVSHPPFISEYYEDFLVPFVATTNTNILVAISGGASATVNYLAPSIDCTTGQIRCTTGTTTLGRAQIYSQNTVLTFGWDTPWVWSTRAKVSQSSNGTDNFTCSIGYGDSITGPNHVDWLGFYYNHNANSGAWSFRSQRAGVMTSSSITYPFTASQYHVFRILVNAAGTTASGYIDDTWMGFITSSIPTGSATFGAFNIGIQKNGGTTARVLDIDYLYVKAFPPSRSQYLTGRQPI